MLWYDSILLTICSHQYIYLSFHSKLCGILDRLVMLITPPSLTFFQPSVTFYIENSYLFCRANQVTGFYINCNTGLKWVKARDSEVAHRILENSLENNRGGFHFSRILRFTKSAFNHGHVFSRNFCKVFRALHVEHFMSAAFSYFFAVLQNVLMKYIKRLYNIFEEAAEKLRNKLVYSSVLKKVNGKIDVVFHKFINPLVFGVCWKAIYV